MDLLPTAVNGAVVAAIGLLLGFLAKGRFDEVDRRFDHFRQEVDRRFEHVDRRFDEVNLRIGDFQRSLDSMRSDVTAIAMAVRARPQTETGSGR